MNIVQNTIHKSIKKPYLNILVLPFVGQFEYDLAKLGHSLFIIDNKDKIDKFCEEHKKPHNITFFPAKDGNVAVPRFISLDLIITNNRISYGLGERLAPFFQVPIILVEHDTPELQKWQKKQINDEIKPNVLVSISEKVFKHWGEVGILVNTEEKWQELFKKLTLGGFYLRKDNFVG